MKHNFGQYEIEITSSNTILVSSNDLRKIGRFFPFYCTSCALDGGTKPNFKFESRSPTQGVIVAQTDKEKMSIFKAIQLLIDLHVIPENELDAILREIFQAEKSEKEEEKREQQSPTLTKPTAIAPRPFVGDMPLFSGSSQSSSEYDSSSSSSEEEVTRDYETPAMRI